MSETRNDDDPEGEAEADRLALFFSEKVTRRDRAPGKHDHAHEQIALKLEELGASFYSPVPSALAAVVKPFEAELQSATFMTLAAEALGIVRERNPDAYDLMISGLFWFDPRIRPLREAFVDASSPPPRVSADSASGILAPAIEKSVRRVRTCWLLVGLALGSLTGALATGIGFSSGMRANDNTWTPRRLSPGLVAPLPPAPPSSYPPATYRGAPLPAPRAT